MDRQTLIVSIMADELINISKYNFLYICKEKRLMLISHNPKVVSSSLTPATTIFIRVARDCGSFIFLTKNLFLQKWGQFGDSPYIFVH